MVRDPKRIPIILKELGVLWERVPDLRLGQLIENLAPDSVWVTEDDEWLEAIMKSKLLTGATAIIKGEA